MKTTYQRANKIDKIATILVIGIVTFFILFLYRGRINFWEDILISIVCGVACTFFKAGMIRIPWSIRKRFHKIEPPEEETDVYTWPER